jgi:hypothetical protein
MDADNILYYCEVEDATTTNCGFSQLGWGLVDWSMQVAFFCSLIPVFLLSVFVGLHFTRK